MPEVTAPKWFEAQTYFNNKLAEMQLDNPGYTSEELQAAFDAGGFTGDDGLYRHFQEYGNTIQENISPNAWFDVNYYMEQKLAQMQQDDPSYTMVQLIQVFNNANLTAWDHYTGWGMYEGINPSSVFNTEDYMNAKLEQMRIDNPEYTMEELDAAFKAADLNPIMHWFGWGENEDLSYEPGAAVVTQELTTGNDIIQPSPDNMTLDGTVTSPAKNSTLNAGDQIDGGEGADTLNVDLGAAFNGFTGDGFMKNVETVNIENTTKSGGAVNFSAKGIEGVDTYNVTGNVNLSNIAAGAGINLIDYNNANATIGFADAEVENLNLGLNNVSGAKDTAVNVKIAGVEKLAIDATGEDANIINLGDSKNTLTDLSISGSADLKITGLDAKLEGIDASAATGKLNIDATAATALNTGKSVTLGSGDDVLTLGNAVDTTIDGGAGNDEVILSGAATALVSELNLTNVETLTIAKNTANVTYSGANTNGLANVQLDSIKADVTLAEFTDEYTLKIKGTNEGDVLVADADALNMVIGDADGSKDASLNGKVTAAAAQSVNLTVNTDADLSKTFDIIANKATEVTITSNVQGDDLDLSSSEFKNLQEATLTSYNEINLGAVGGDSTTLSIDASGVKADNGFTVIVNKYAGSEDGTDVSITGSNLGKNNITFNKGYDTIDFTGGLVEDTVNINLDAKAEVDITLNTGVGTDVINITQDGAAKSLTISGNLGGDGEKLGTSAATALVGDNVNLSELSGYTSAYLKGSANPSTLAGGSGDDILIGDYVAFGVKSAGTTADPGDLTFNIDTSKDIAATTSISLKMPGESNAETIVVTPTAPATTVSDLSTALSSALTDSTGGNTWNITAEATSGTLTITLEAKAAGIYDFSTKGNPELSFTLSEGTVSLTTTAATGSAGSAAKFTWTCADTKLDDITSLKFDLDGASKTTAVEVSKTITQTGKEASLDDIETALQGKLGTQYDVTLTDPTAAGGMATVTITQKNAEPFAGGTVAEVKLQSGTSGSYAEITDAATSEHVTDGVAYTPANDGKGIADTFTGGAGADIFNVAVSDATAGSASASITTTITDFGNGADKIIFNGASAASLKNVTPGADGTALTDAASFLAVCETGANAVSVGQVGANTLVGFGNGTGVVAIVQLTGVTAADLTQADFTATV